MSQLWTPRQILKLLGWLVSNLPALLPLLALLALLELLELLELLKRPED